MNTANWPETIWILRYFVTILSNTQRTAGSKKDTEPDHFKHTHKWLLQLVVSGNRIAFEFKESLEVDTCATYISILPFSVPSGPQRGWISSHLWASRAGLSQLKQNRLFYLQIQGLQAYKKITRERNGLKWMNLSRSLLLSLSLSLWSHRGTSRGFKLFGAE